MRIFLLLCLFSQMAFAKAPVGDLKGHEAYSDMIKVRMLKDRRYFAVRRIIGEVYPLLGEFNGIGSLNKMVNTSPGTLNYVLYHFHNIQFAELAAHVCVSREPKNWGVTFHREFFKQLLHYCDNPVKKGKKLRKLWDTVMGYEVPEVEYKEYKKFALKINKSGWSQVKELILAMTLNPHFLLEK